MPPPPKPSQIGRPENESDHDIVSCHTKYLRTLGLFYHDFSASMPFSRGLFNFFYYRNSERRTATNIEQLLSILLWQCCSFFRQNANLGFNRVKQHTHTSKQQRATEVHMQNISPYPSPVCFNRYVRQNTGRKKGGENFEQLLKENNGINEKKRHRREEGRKKHKCEKEKRRACFCCKKCAIAVIIKAV